jgi:hypothetical protein
VWNTCQSQRRDRPFCQAEAEQAQQPEQSLQAEAQQAEAQQAEQPERRCKRVAEPRSFKRWGQVSVRELAEKMQIDTTAISDYNWQFLIDTGFYVDKNGRAGEQDYLLNARNALMAFVPRLSKQRSATDKALAQINNAVYPSLRVLTQEVGAPEIFIGLKDLGQLLSQHIGKAGAAAGGAAGQEQAIAPRAAAPDKHMTVFIGGAPTQITVKYCLAGDIADVFGIDTMEATKFNRNAIIAKIVHGPPGLQGKWDLCTLMMAYHPTKWKARKYATRDLAMTSIENYSSRTEVQMVHHNVSLPNFLYESY